MILGTRQSISPRTASSHETAFERESSLLIAWHLSGDIIANGAEQSGHPAEEMR
jgi:hypothetical protein